MRELFIVFALIIAMLSYVYYSVSVRTWANVLTPGFVLAVPLYYIFELLYLKICGNAGSIEAYWYVYLAYAVINAVIVFILVFMRVPTCFVNIKPPGFNVRFLPYILLAISYLVYMPVLFEFREYILNPRVIYIHTRTGYGMSFFLSSALTNLAYVLFLFKRSTFKYEHLLVFLLCSISAFLHGSKIQIITLVFILLLYKVYVGRVRISFMKFISLTCAMVLGLSILFSYFSSEMKVTQLLQNMIYYSDYTRNAIMVIDDDRPALLGKLKYEDEFYSRIPRKLMPNKPKDFGSFYLSRLYYPEQFEADSGSPAFGIGSTYADFKHWTIFYLAFTSALLAYCLKIFLNRTMLYGHPGDFIMLLFFAGVGLIPLGVGYLVPEHLIMAIVISVLLSIKINFVPQLCRLCSFLRAKSANE